MRYSSTGLRCYAKPFDMHCHPVAKRHHCLTGPSALSVLWRLPEGDTDYARRWRLIKAGFSRAVAEGERQSASRLRKGERGIWQRRYWEHLIRDEADYARHMDYIHYNPVKHGYVMQAKDWPYSSFARWVKRGMYAENWGVSERVRGMDWE